MASPSGGKLWDKSEPLDALIERFTVGDDYQLDSALVAADCVASLAHATMLAAIAVIAPGDLEQLRSGLLAALQQAEEGSFVIERADEDGHTALERFLTRHTAAGARIHTGRSRNDQVMAALRLYGRDALVALQRLVLDLADALLGFAAAHERRSMPGRTHTQIAMPSTLGLWAAAFAEELLDDLALLETCYRLTNRSPLGSAAGYGAPLPLDREQVAALLGCDGPVHNVLAAANSRGKLEAITLDALDQVAMTLSRLAQDLMLFSLPELGYVTLPVELCTGSSIMPHKRNPDGLELVRARAATVSGLAGGVKGIVRTLPSGYHRDLQETKRPYLQGFEIVAGQLSVMLLTVERLQVHDDALTRALTPELFATDTAFALVRGGMAFRDAYRAASGTEGGAMERDDLGAEAEAEAALARRTATGMEGGAMERDDLGAEAEAALARRTATGMEGGAMERADPGAEAKAALARRTATGMEGGAMERDDPGAEAEAALARRTATGMGGGAMGRDDLGAEAEAALARRTATGMEGGAMERADLGAEAEAALARRTATGTAGNLDLRGCRRRTAAERRRVDGEAARTGAALARLVGRPVQVCRGAWLHREAAGA